MKYKQKIWSFGNHLYQYRLSLRLPWIRWFLDSMLHHDMESCFHSMKLRASLQMMGGLFQAVFHFFPRVVQTLDIVYVLWTERPSTCVISYKFSYTRPYIPEERSWSHCRWSLEIYALLDNQTHPIRLQDDFDTFELKLRNPQDGVQKSANLFPT